MTPSGRWRWMPQSAAPRLAAPFLSITGGKGGVGKTTLAANLAVTLARDGVKVLIVDVDFALANLDIVLGLDPARTVAAFFGDERSLRECVVEGPAGLHVLPAASGLHELAGLADDDRERFLEELSELSADYDLVIADCPAGIGADVLAFCSLADHVLVVTSPDPAAVTDAYGVIKALDAWSTEVDVEMPTPEVVVNFATDAAEADAVTQKLAAVCRRFLARSPVLGGWLPRCDAVRRATQSRRLYSSSAPLSLSSQCTNNLARRLARRAGAHAVSIRG